MRWTQTCCSTDAEAKTNSGKCMLGKRRFATSLSLFLALSSFLFYYYYYLKVLNFNENARRVEYVRRQENEKEKKKKEKKKREETETHLVCSRRPTTMTTTVTIPRRLPLTPFYCTTYHLAQLTARVMLFPRLYSELGTHLERSPREIRLVPVIRYVVCRHTHDSSMAFHIHN